MFLTRFTGVVVATLASLALLGACAADPETSELGVGGGSSSTVASSSASGAGKALPCGAAKTCPGFCCLVSHDGGGTFCAAKTTQCPNTAFIKTECAGTADCDSGQVCCGATGDRFFTACRAYCADGEETFCESQADCAAGTCTDVTWNGPTGYRACR